MNFADDNQEKISFAVHKWGNTELDIDLNCAKNGPVFNPLQDPEIPEPTDRGAIDDWIPVEEDDNFYEITQ